MPFKPGQSGNPSGRPRDPAQAEVKRLAQVHGPKAIERLAELMHDENGKVAVAACSALLDRGYGKPPQAITGEDGGPVAVEVGGRYALMTLSDEDLDALDRITEKIERAKQPGGEGGEGSSPRGEGAE